MIHAKEVTQLKSKIISLKSQPKLVQSKNNEIPIQIGKWKYEQNPFKTTVSIKRKGTQDQMLKYFERECYEYSKVEESINLIYDLLHKEKMR